MDYDLQDYLFDLNGYFVIENAVDVEHIAELNVILDTIPPDLEPGDWWGNARRQDGGKDSYQGIEIQNIVECGEPFERLIDHPAWVDRVTRYCGEYDSYYEGLFIDECFASLRRSGGSFPMHSGANEGYLRNAYRMVNGKWFCGQVNIIVALTDIGPGDGGTLVLPGSHKQNFAHPQIDGKFEEQLEVGLTNIVGVVEAHLNKGDALLFTDTVCHGATERTNEGERRVVIYRYGPRWCNTRFGYRYSDELLERVTPAQREILQPIPVMIPGEPLMPRP